MSERIALFPLQTVLFPAGPLPLRIFEPRYVDLVGRCLKTGTGFGVVLILEGGEVGQLGETAGVGTYAHIEDFSQLPDGLLGLFCRGGKRFRLLAREREADGLNVGDVEWIDEGPAEPLPSEYQPLADLLDKVLPELGALYANAAPRLDDAAWVGCRLAEILPVEQREKQALLEADALGRLQRLAPLLRRSDRENESAAN